MKKIAGQLYFELRTGLQQQWNAPGCMQKKTERCFALATRQWIRLEEKLRHHEFKNKAAEIAFFKQTKPRFTLEIEYFHLLYYSLLFYPQDYIFDCLLFWQREQLRMQKFIQANETFYKYLQSRRQDEDHVFYTRLGCDSPLQSVSRLYDHDGRTTSAYDPLLATYLALKRYGKKVDRELSACLWGTQKARCLRG